MQLPEVERLCRAIVPGTGSVDLEALGAGLLSETYRVARGGAVYSLKVALEHRPDLRADLPWQVRVLESAASAGIAPRLVFRDLERAVLLTRWAEGPSWVSQQAAAPANLGSMAALLRKVHALAVPMPARQVSPLQWIKIYAAAMSRPISISSDPALRTAALARAESLADLPRAVDVVCHSDLHAMNLIQGHDSLILLDWEYAHVADPLWDLASWCANNDFDAEMQRALMSQYLQETPNATQWQRFRLLLALYDYVCLLWSQLYLSVRGAEASGVAERLRLLDARLRLPAHYAP
jgi:thiamine kinase-like enzyme